MPQALIDREIGHPGLTELQVVDSMHERKARMAELADAFVAVPGGIGTLEELIEVYTWSQLGIHDKPCGVLNVRGYYDALAAFLDHAVRRASCAPQHRAVAHASPRTRPSCSTRSPPSSRRASASGWSSTRPDAASARARRTCRSCARIIAHARGRPLVGRRRSVGRPGRDDAHDRGRRPDRRADPVRRGARRRSTATRASTSSSTPRCTAAASARRRSAGSSAT